jgi:hypothetical protein
MDAKAVGSYIELTVGEDEYRMTKEEAKTLIAKLLQAVAEVVEEAPGLGINVSEHIKGTTHMGG